MRAKTRLIILSGALVSAFAFVLPTAVTPASAAPLDMPAHVVVDGGPPAAAPTTVGAVSAPSTPASVTVRNGDSLSSIAEVLGRSWMQLAGFNRVADPNLILPGLVLRVPPTGYMPPPLPIPAPPAHRVVTAAASSPAPAPAPAPAPVSGGGLPWPWNCIAAGVGAHPPGSGESGGNPAENTGNGYYGAFQFAPTTWDSMMAQLGLGYRGYPYAAAAPMSVQLQAAELLQRQAGWGQWPQTSRACGLY